MQRSTKHKKKLLREVVGIARRCIRPISCVSVLTKCCKSGRDLWRFEGDLPTDCPSTSKLKKQSVGDSVPRENGGAVHRSAETDAGSRSHNF
jgi:hypothetical protein